MKYVALFYYNNIFQHTSVTNILHHCRVQGAVTITFLNHPIRALGSIDDVIICMIQQFGNATFNTYYCKTEFSKLICVICQLLHIYPN